MHANHHKIDLSDVAIFPLPRVVLMPHGVLPLHIFEYRYRDMMEDVLARDDAPVLAMAQLAPGWKDGYMGTPKIYPAVCVGVINQYDRLPDGRFNLILNGIVRARVVREIGGKTFRRAELEPIRETPASPEQLERIRQRLIALCTSSTLTQHEAASREILRLAESRQLPVPVLMDVVLNSVCDDPDVKQEALGQGDVARRLTLTMDALERAFPLKRPKLRHDPPSMN